MSVRRISLTRVIGYTQLQSGENSIVQTEFFTAVDGSETYLLGGRPKVSIATSEVMGPAEVVAL